MSKSGSKEKEKTIPEKLKTFFRRVPKTTVTNSPHKRCEEFVLTQEIVKEVSADVPINQRTKMLRELNEIVLTKRLEDNAVEALWLTTEDLFQPNTPKETRQIALIFLRNLIQGQYEKLGIVRAKFFSFIQKHKVTEDFSLRFDLLKTLTDNGKEIVYFEEEMGPFILDWMPELLNSNKAHEFLPLLENVIKFNSAFLEQKILEELVSNTCLYICCTNSEENILRCLLVLEVFVCYSCLPSESLNCLIFSLCRTANVEKFCLISWKLMRNLLGTHLGHSTVYTLCNILQDKQNSQDFSLLRGSVFFLSMGLWGETRVTSLQHPPISVLPSFMQCLQLKDANVATEVSLAIKRLVQKNGNELYLITWDLIMDILQELYQLSEGLKYALLSGTVTETLIAMEDLYEASNFGGSVERLFSLFERCSLKLPESSVLQLMHYKAQIISPLKASWLTNLDRFVDKFYRNEKRTNIRVKAIEVLSSIIEHNKQVYEEDMIDKIVLPLLKNIENETDTVVCNVAVQLLVTLTRDCTSKRCIDMLELIRKVINKPWEQSNKVDVNNILRENEIEPVQTAALGLVQIFKVKLFQLPSVHALEAYKIMLAHMNEHFPGSVILDKNIVRLEILRCFLQLRCNQMNQIGLIDNDGKVSYSPYLLCASSSEKTGTSTASPPVSSPTPFSKIPCTLMYLSPDKAVQTIMTALISDNDWEIHKLILSRLPSLLQNQAFMLSGQNAVARLCTHLCSMVGDVTPMKTLLNKPSYFSRADYHSYVLPVIASLVSYHKYLDNGGQCRLVKCLTFGFITKRAHICISALTLCIMEMQETLYRLLPDVLLNLSKISATVGISIPILEFLSSLIRLPKLYACFVEDQYMSIFAIVLPYINPFKFNHYTVALAYHVIAMWFLKCRLPFRKDFVKFIIQGLQSNVLVPLEESENTGLMQSMADDASGRRRASSMNEQALLQRNRRERSIVSGSCAAQVEPRLVLTQQVKELNIELIETCIDLMARYTFAACSALPKRFPASSFLLAGGQSMTWLLGTKLITVTTSGCSSKVLKQGLCDKCYLMCKGEKGDKFDDNDLTPLRRRHRSAIQRSVSSEVHVSQPQTKDDLQLQKASFSEFKSSDSAPLVLRSLNQNENKKSLEMGSSQEIDTQNLDKLLFGFQDSSTSAPAVTSRRCNCWCQGWAEILVRRSTGNVSWMMRVQNQPHLLESASDFPLADISMLLLPSHLNSENGGVDAYKLLANHKRIDSESLEEKEYEKIFQEHFDSGSSGTDKEVEEKLKKMEKKGTIKSADKSTLTVDNSTSPLKKIPTNNSYKVTPSGKLLREKSNLRKINSNPELFRSAGGNLESFEDIRKDRVESDAAVIIKKPSAKQRAERRSMLKSECFPSAHRRKVNIDTHQYKPVSRAESMKESKVTESPKQPKHPESEPTTPEVMLREKDTKDDTDKPLQSSLRRHSSTREERRDMLPEGMRLVRRGSERGVHFDLKTQSPPHSPSRKKEDQSIFSLSNFRDRGHTISTANPAPRPYTTNEESKRGPKDLYRSGINPSFVFLQLYHDSCFGSDSEIPLLLPQSSKVYERALKCFDCIPPYETHKIGVVYVGKDQVNNEAAILSNTYGSLRYVEFLKGLGHLINLKEINPQTTYIGGLEQTGEDGKFAYIWQDDVMQVIFHVATLMPNKKNDPSCISKKRHIGNDYVTIVYNDSGEDFNIQTIKAQFMYACIVIHPQDHGTNSVIVKTKPDLAELISHNLPKIISTHNLPILARQLALHANLASLIFQSQTKAGSCNPYASNWLERLRDLKRLRKKLLEEAIAPTSKENISGEHVNILPQQHKLPLLRDFTDFV